MAKTITYGGVKLDVFGSSDPLVPTTAREIEIPSSYQTALGIAMKENLATLLLGETGTGKTSVIKYLAYLTHQPYVRVNMTGYTTPDELIGSKSVKKGETYFEHGIISDCMIRGGVLVIDEINATTPDCLFILHGLLDDDRRVTLPNGEVLTPHKNFRVFATGNVDYEGTKSMNKAFMDRFPIILPFETLSPTLERNLLKERTGIETPIATELVAMASLARKDYFKNKLSVYISTRTLLQTCHLIQNGLSQSEAYRVSVAHKSSSVDEQKMLMDFYAAVRKEAGGEGKQDEIVFISKKELNELKSNKGTTEEEELKRDIGIIPATASPIYRFIDPTNGADRQIMLDNARRELYITQNTLAARYAPGATSPGLYSPYGSLRGMRIGFDELP